MRSYAAATSTIPKSIGFLLPLLRLVQLQATMAIVAVVYVTIVTSKTAQLTKSLPGDSAINYLRSSKIVILLLHRERDNSR